MYSRCDVIAVECLDGLNNNKLIQKLICAFCWFYSSFMCSTCLENRTELSVLVPAVACVTYPSRVLEKRHRMAILCKRNAHNLTKQTPILIAGLRDAVAWDFILLGYNDESLGNRFKMFRYNVTISY